MSRWIDTYENHSFQDVWKQILDVAQRTSVADQTVLTEVQELARVKKIVKYIDELLKACDPELVPDATWENFVSQSNPCLTHLSNFDNEKNVGDLVQANKHLDNLLTYIRPYIVSTGEAANAAKRAFSAYNQAISDSLGELRRETHETVGEIAALNEEAANFVQKIEKINKELEDLKIRWLEDDEGQISVQTRVTKLVADIDDGHGKLLNYYDALFTDSDEESISTEIEGAKKSATENSANIENLFEEAEQRLEKLSEFYELIFGSSDSSDSGSGGLKLEIKKRINDLDEFGESQKIKYKEIVSQIDQLLPGALSAGLASAYCDRKEKYNWSVWGNTIGFFASVILIFAAAIYFAFPLLTVGKSVGASVDIYSLLSNMLSRGPVFIPLIWAAFLTSKGRSQSLRLREEYAHKETLARSYESFKVQVEELGEEENELLEMLLGTAIAAIGKNAAATLDGKHGEEPPTNKLLEKFVFPFRRERDSS